MKRSACALLAVVVVPAFVGCGNGEPANDAASKARENSHWKADFSDGPVQAGRLWVTPAASEGAAALFGEIRFDSVGADTLVEVATEAATRSVVHETIENPNYSGMRPLKAPPVVTRGENLEFRPGGLHVMLEDVTSTLSEGDSVDVLMRFSSGRRLPVRAAVRSTPPIDEGNGSGVSEQAGAQVYAEYCRSCHGGDGKGVPGVFPPLEGSEFLENKEKAIDAVVNGLEGPIDVDGVQYNGIMQPLPGAYSDEEAAAVINYTVGRFGSADWTTDAEEVGSIRR